MRINRISIRNFKPYKKSRLPVEGQLPDGLFVVQGPNSSGKTSLVEAVFWGLWGPRAIRGVNQEQLIRKNESSCQVTLDFEVEEAQYRIRRKYTRGSGATAVLFKKGDGKYLPIETNVTPVENRLDQILGISCQEALQTLFIQQGEVNRLAEATPAELRDLVRDLFGLERLEKINDVLKDHAKTLDKEIRGIEKKLAVLPEKEKQKENLEKKLEELKNRQDDLSQLITELQQELKRIPQTKTLKELKNLQSKIQDIHQKLETEQKQLKLRKERKDEIRKEVKETTRQLNEEQEEHQKIAEQMEKLPNAAAINKLREISKQITLYHRGKTESASDIRRMADKADLPFDPIQKTEKMPDFSSQLKQITKKTGEEIEEHRRTVDELNKYLGTLTGRKDELDKNIETLKGEKECPTCLRPLPEQQLPKVIQGIQSRISEIGTNIQKLKKQITGSKEKRQKLSHQLEETKNKINAVSYIQESLQRHLKEAKKEEEAIQQRNAELERLGYSNLQEMLSTWQVDSLPQLTEKRGKISSQVTAHEREIQRLEKKLEKLDQQQTAVQEKQEKVEDRIEELKKDLETTRESLEATLETLEAETIPNLLKTYQKKTVDELIVYRTKKQTELKGKKEAEEELRNQIQETDQKHDKTVEEIQELHKKEELLKENKKKHTHIEHLRILVDDFISEDVVRNRLCGALKQVTTGYLTRFSTGRYSLLDVDAPRKGPYGAGVIITLKDHVDQLEKTRELLSGGDRASLGLALRMAISRLISRIRPFKSQELERPKVKCLIMDEPLGSLDSERRPEVVRTLMDDTAFHQIFLITHTDLLLSEEELTNAHQISIHQEERVSKISYQPAKPQEA